MMCSMFAKKNYKLLSHTSHLGKGVPDLELAAVTVHPHLQLHRVELLPLPALPLPAGSHQRRHHSSH